MNETLKRHEKKNAKKTILVQMNIHNQTTNTKTIGSSFISLRTTTIIEQQSKFKEKQGFTHSIQFLPPWDGCEQNKNEHRNGHYAPREKRVTANQCRCIGSSLKISLPPMPSLLPPRNGPMDLLKAMYFIILVHGPWTNPNKVHGKKDRSRTY